jgi:hypothetical protein
MNDPFSEGLSMFVGSILTNVMAQSVDDDEPRAFEQ